MLERHQLGEPFMIEERTTQTISEERKHYLLKKWGAVLDYTELSDDEYFKKYKKQKADLKTAYILEGQESYIIPK